jgi:hypothetical protein
MSQDIAPAKKFRIASKGFFLTFPQCPAPRETLAALVATKGDIDKGIIGQEKHQDGNLHLHAYVKYQQTINVKSPKYFDIEY